MVSAQTPQVGQYYLIEKIAQGGMAEIYRGLATDVAGIQKNVCIKKILPQLAASKEFIEMLINEAKIAVKLNHGNIAQIYDLGKAGDDYFIVMEYVEGQSLSKIFKKAIRKNKQIALPILLTMIAEVASGLDYMQRKTDETGQSLHIVHRDISPQNIMISYSGTVKIIDFGIAKGQMRVEATESGVLKGKFAYMSPEQAAGEFLDHRSDIFSLGVIFYELLTGKRLFKASDSKQTLRNVRKAKFVPPSLVVPDLPKALDAIAEKALAKDRKYRYAFASEFQEDLLKFIHTHYPDFSASQIAEWMRGLFQEEMELEKQLSKRETMIPQLVLEKSQSSISKTQEEEHSEQTKNVSPEVNWGDYLLEEENEASPIERSAKQEEENEESETSFKEKTARQWFKSPLSFQKQVLIVGVILLSGFLFTLKFWQGRHSKETKSAKINKITTSPLAVESPKEAAVEIRSEPPGAKIYLNDKDTGLFTPNQLTKLDPSQIYMIGLYLEGYQFSKIQAPLEVGKTKRLEVALTPDYASLKIISAPPEADVFLNGIHAGQTPLEQTSLKPGETVTIEIKKEGYQAFQKELQTESGKTHIIQAILESLPPSH